jgi:hypothetical protein
MALPADGIQITYAAPAGCPSDATFLWQVRSRIHEVHALATRYEIVLSSDARQVRGVLRVQEENRETVRDLAGASCGEVAEGLALSLLRASYRNRPSHRPLPRRRCLTKRPFLHIRRPLRRVTFRSKRAAHFSCGTPSRRG